MNQALKKAKTPPRRHERARAAREAERPTRAEETVRQCLVTRERYPKEVMIRFVRAPDGAVTPDLRAKLPGRGVWVLADRATLDTAVTKRLFARGFHEAVTADADLAERVGALLARRTLDLMGQALGAGLMILGASGVQKAAREGTVRVAILACDAAEDSRRKTLGALKAGSRSHGAGATPDYLVIGCFTSQELSLALGRENVVHAALPEGGLSDRLQAEARRLEGFRALIPDAWALKAVPAPPSGRARQRLEKRRPVSEE